MGVSLLMFTKTVCINLVICERFQVVNMQLIKFSENSIDLEYYRWYSITKLQHCNQITTL